MSHEQAGRVFLSYASQDAAEAQKACAALETAEQRCWIAPRDVRAGEFYASAIVEAIGNCRMLVLLLSRAAIESPHVLREVERACSKRIPVLTVRLDGTPIPAQLEYFLSANQWLDVSSGPIERVLPELVSAVSGHLAGPHQSALPAAVRPGPQRGSAGLVKRRALLGGALAGLGILAVLVLLLFVKPAGQQAPAAAMQVPAQSQSGAISVAVLPLVNLSSDKDQEFFSDGMTEEITAALAKVAGLTVIGRTSAFQFKGSNQDLRAIGKALNATRLIEGSVRKAGDKVRITVQLIKADDGTHLWTES